MPLDSTSLIEAIVDAVEEGVRASLVDIKNRARHYAPVRKLFKGGYPTHLSFAKIKPVNRSRLNLSGLPTGVGVRNQNPIGQTYSLATRQAYAITGDSKYPLIGSGHSQGRQNSSVPTTRKLAVLGNQRLIGTHDHTFREVQRSGSGYAFLHTKVRYRVGSKTRILDLRDEFLARANYDIAHNRGIVKLAGDEHQYGGTLRDSIEVVDVTRSGTTVEGYVKASAVEHGFNYAYAQEMGTAHNRAQPYLRPALREMYKHLANRQRTAIKLRLQGRSFPVRLIATELEVTITQQGSDVGRRLDSQFARAGFIAR